jgi:hypothetical protein
MKMPKQFPITHDKFLALLLPAKSGRTADKASLYKAYLRENITVERWKLNKDHSKPLVDFAPTQDEINQLYGKHRAEPITAQMFSLEAPTFAIWYANYRHHKTSEARRTAANQRWHDEKPKPKKTKKKRRRTP